MHSNARAVLPVQALPLETIHLGMSAAAAVIRNPEHLTGFESPWQPYGPEIERMFLAIWETVRDWAVGPLDEDLFSFESVLLFKRVHNASFGTTCVRLLDSLLAWGATALEVHYTIGTGKRYFTPAPFAVQQRTLEDMYLRYRAVAVRFHTEVTARTHTLTPLRMKEVRAAWERG